MVEQQRNLTQDQVDTLPLGTRLIVTWSGGNGPHLYCLIENWRANGARVIPEFMLKHAIWCPMILDRAGEYPQTTVRVATDAEIYKEQTDG